MNHLVLLGDSIFDNAAYTSGAPDVVHQLRLQLPPGWRATLVAVDGGTTESVRDQLRSLPPDATHLIVSAGGNDALGHIDFLGAPVGSAVEGGIARTAWISGSFIVNLRWLEAGGTDLRAGPVQG